MNNTRQARVSAQSGFLVDTVTASEDSCEELTRQGPATLNGRKGYWLCSMILRKMGHCVLPTKEEKKKSVYAHLTQRKSRGTLVVDDEKNLATFK